MHFSLNRGPSDPIPATGIKVILVTNDQAHARMMMGAFAQSQYAYLVCELKVRQTLAADLKTEIGAVRGQLPVIVMIDFAFVPGACEAIVAQVAALKGDMAIECLVTRPPASATLCDRLRDAGAFLFGEGADLPLSVLEIH